MNVNVDDLKQTMQGYIVQLNQLNQKVNEVVGAIKAVQQLIFTLENPPTQESELQEQTTEDAPVSEQDVMQ